MKKKGNKKMPRLRQEIIDNPIPTSLFMCYAAVLLFVGTGDVILRTSNADFKCSPLLTGGCSAGQVLVGSSVEGNLSEYATIPCLSLPVFSARVSDYCWWPTIDL